MSINVFKILFPKANNGTISKNKDKKVSAYIQQNKNNPIRSMQYNNKTQQECQ